MPCYTEWDAYLAKGTKEYKDKKEELEAKLKAVKHIVDYYYGIEGLQVPHATHSGQQTHIEMAHRQFEINKEDLLRIVERQIIKKMAHHCSCDNIYFTELYDLVSLLNIHQPEDAGYARAILTCANEIRARQGDYRPVSPCDLALESELTQLDPKRLP